MRLGIGDKITCHTNGHMSVCGTRFATKGKKYRIVEICLHHSEPDKVWGYRILDDRNRKHMFSAGNIKCGVSNWFYAENKLITEKIEDFSFFPRRLLTEKTIDFFQGIVI